MNTKQDMYKSLRQGALLSLTVADNENSKDEIARLWDTLLSNVTVGEFRLIEKARQQVLERYFNK